MLDFIGDASNDLLKKHTPTLIGMGAGAGAIAAVRSAVTEGETEVSMIQNVAIDLGLFLGAGWAANEYTRGMAGKVTQGLILAGSLSLVNDVWTAVTDGQGVLEYMSSLFAGTEQVNI